MFFHLLFIKTNLQKELYTTGNLLLPSKRGTILSVLHARLRAGARSLVIGVTVLGVVRPHGDGRAKQRKSPRPEPGAFA